jgi:hypothetical protein
MTAPLTLNEVPADELPNGLPMFGVFLHLPAVDTRWQVFRFLHSYLTPGVTLHTLLVHPQDWDATEVVAGAIGVFQLHGEIWVLRDGRHGLTLGRTDHGIEFTISAAAELVDRDGAVIAAVEHTAFHSDDLARVRLLCAAFRTQYDDDALSIPLIRAYPGRTSLIRETRPFPRLLRGDPIGPGTDTFDPWGYLDPEEADIPEPSRG